MYTAIDRTREIRLRNTAKRQGLTLHKSHVRDPRAIGYGLFHITDENNNAVAGTSPWDYSMNLDHVEIHLADADDFDVYFEDPLGDYWNENHLPYLEWKDSYHIGKGWESGWLLTQCSDHPNDDFILRRRTELAAAVIEARKVLLRWTNDDAAGEI